MNKKHMHLIKVFLQPKLVMLFGLSENTTISAIVGGIRIIIITYILCTNIYALFPIYNIAALYMYNIYIICFLFR